jgi:Ribosomal S13/S15 N-terminal domain
VEESIYKFAKKGMTPSQIGVILRDSHGIAQVRSVTGSKILRILKAHGMVLYFFYFVPETVCFWYCKYKSKNYHVVVTEATSM